MAITMNDSLMNNYMIEELVGRLRKIFDFDLNFGL